MSTVVGNPLLERLKQAVLDNAVPTELGRELEGELSRLLTIEAEYQGLLHKVDALDNENKHLRAELATAARQLR